MDLESAQQRSLHMGIKPRHIDEEMLMDEEDMDRMAAELAALH